MIPTMVKRWATRREEPRPEVVEPAFLAHRRVMSTKYLRGSGIEIGGLNAPLPVGPRVRVTHVDRMRPEQLREQYPELAGVPLARVDVVDNGERLTRFADESQDFVIANHFLEHTQDPIGTLGSHLRVLKSGGILYLAVPNRHHTFDRRRPATPWEHLRRDHLDGPAGSYEEHLREYAALVDGLEGDALEARIADLRARQYSIHFHVWNEAEFRAILALSWAEFRLPFAIESCESRDHEILAILRKTA